MKATKKIVGAACALIAAVALTAGSTFAWFSSNSEVNVTGMRVQAVVPDALFIKNGRVTSVAEITETSLDYADDSTTKLNPATMKAVTENVEYAVMDADKNNWVTPPTGGTPGDAGENLIKLGTFNNESTAFAPVSGQTPTNYATMYVMSVARINNKMDDKLQADVVFTFNNADGDNTYEFVRCGFLTSTGWKSIPNEEVATVCDYNTPSANTVTFHYNGANAVITDFDGNTAYTIQFVVWFEGTDKDCYVNKALTTHDISVKITYTTESENPPQTPATPEAEEGD